MRLPVATISDSHKKILIIHRPASYPQLLPYIKRIRCLIIRLIELARLVDSLLMRPGMGVSRSQKGRPKLGCQEELEMRGDGESPEGVGT